MAIEIIPKKITRIPLWLNILFYFSLFLLIISISSYFILAHFQKESALQLSNLEEALAKEKTPQKISLEKEILSLRNKINDFSQLIEQHLFISNVFNFLEKICHPKTWFSKFSLNSRENQMILSGKADNFPALSQQLLILKSQVLIENVNLSKISIGEKGEVEFTLNLFLNPKIFK